MNQYQPRLENIIPKLEIYFEQKKKDEIEFFYDTKHDIFHIKNKNIENFYYSIKITSKGFSTYLTSEKDKKSVLIQKYSYNKIFEKIPDHMNIESHLSMIFAEEIEIIFENKENFIKEVIEEINNDYLTKNLETINLTHIFNFLKKTHIFNFLKNEKEILDINPQNSRNFN